MSISEITIPKTSPRRTAHFATRWLPSSTAIVTAHGELDAANADEFFSYAASHSGRMTQLVLDLTGVDFFGTSGFSALHSLNVRCAADGPIMPGAMRELATVNANRTITRAPRQTETAQGAN